MDTIQAGRAMVKVLEAWGVDHIYGVPGGSINTTMDALYQEREGIQYIQVRHEEVGALAAAADAKLTGKIGVCFGSAGPGATHLFNGLYDAKMDHVPVLAIIGQVSSKFMNYDYFQEMNENPMFVDVSVYNRTVMTPESLPRIIDEAVRIAYQQNGVAVVTIPVDLADVVIADDYAASAGAYKKAFPEITDIEAIAEAVQLIEHAERPVIFAGQGTRGARKELIELSEHFSMPVIQSVLAKGIMPDDHPNFMGMLWRLGTKPSVEAINDADLLVLIGSDFPFAQAFPKDAKCIQIDINAANFGKRHSVDVSILGDAGSVMRELVIRGSGKPETAFLKACQINRQNWRKWLQGFMDDTSAPLRTEAVYKQINRIAEKDAVFSVDVGNSTTQSVRLLEMNEQQRFITSGWFATMGFGLPGAIAASLSYPGRQVFSINGDGAFAMVMQDYLTQIKYHLPAINVVFSNDSLGFIEAEQEATEQQKFGVDLLDADFAKFAEACGGVGYRVETAEELEDAFNAAAASDMPVIIDVKTANIGPLPTEALVLDEQLGHTPEAIAAFKEKYEVHDMPLLREIIAEL